MAHRLLALFWQRCHGAQLMPASPSSTGFPATLPPCLPPARVLGMALTSNTTHYSRNQLHANRLRESRIIKLPVIGLTSHFT